MMKYRDFNVGDIVYVVLPPNNHKKVYRYVKCQICRIYYRRTAQRTSIKFDSDADSNKKLYDSITVTLSDINNSHNYYYNKHLDKIYYEDEVEILNKDVDILNKILEYKQKQKEELENYVNTEFFNQTYNGKIKM